MAVPLIVGADRAIRSQSDVSIDKKVTADFLRAIDDDSFLSPSIELWWTMLRRVDLAAMLNMTPQEFGQAIPKWFRSEFPEAVNSRLDEDSDIANAGFIYRYRRLSDTMTHLGPGQRKRLRIQGIVVGTLSGLWWRRNFPKYAAKNSHFGELCSVSPGQDGSLLSEMIAIGEEPDPIFEAAVLACWQKAMLMTISQWRKCFS